MKILVVTNVNEALVQALNILLVKHFYVKQGGPHMKVHLFWHQTCKLECGYHFIYTFECCMSGFIGFYILKL